MEVVKIKQIKMNTFKIKYEVQTAGWASLAIKMNEERFTFAVSYLFDSLGDLTLKTLHLLQHEKYDGYVSFVDEPGEFHFCLERTKKEFVQITGKWSDEYTGWEGIDLTSVKIKTLFTLEINPLIFAQEVISNLDKIYSTYGLSGYRARWKNHHFPYTNYLKLKEVFDEISNTK